ncbi:AraC family transcriptional regulator [Winogradskya humida]|uniref:AraC family transcriptional regulator n=1 Tax=Winogradskya humida TaxID=113566 RepID=A0ABQ4A086_9ACTN|nr:AraC family transcriptional regulator [Actinoplanes humidus]GIE24228.1 AraC family transcriptional regulator [Actinoplanes humidus]
MTPARFTLSAATAAMFADVGIPAGPVLRAAGLPEDLFLHGPAALTPPQFYRCWTAMEELAGDPAIGSRLAARMSTETFQPPIFAALCSADLRSAAERIALYKRLLGPQQLTLTGDLTLTMHWPAEPSPPPGLVAYELAFWVALARLGTRTRITPARILMPDPPRGPAADAWRDYLGVPFGPGAAPAVVFTAADARRPFLTSNAEMWQLLEPDLRRRLADLDRAESTTERVRAALVELLPAGRATAGGVARRLALSDRTLQRRLAGEHTTFQAVLEHTRSTLARGYLSRPDVSVPEVALLLGYDEPSSFYRAFRRWSGTTPQRSRAAS